MTRLPSHVTARAANVADVGMTTPTTIDPFDDENWKRIGAEAGRRNEPRVASGPATARTLLQSAWKAELRSERLAFLDALDALNKRRTNAKRRLHDVHAQAASDPRQAAALPMLMEKDRQLADERFLICDQFRQVVETITHRAQECDATWRAANEQHRDRRLSIEPTDFTVPADILAIPPDPFA
jgi:hypothetical protein